MRSIGHFQMEQRAIPYSDFVPQLYNLCLSFGFEQGKIMPSRAFCSDENQGSAVMLLAKHFGTFPFNHGRVGGIMATDRHGPHAHHGQDMVIVQASHVGYDPESGQFGTYRRLQTTACESSTDCGKVAGVTGWYVNEYHVACENILVERRDDELLLTIDNQLLDRDRDEGLMLNLEQMLQMDGVDFVCTNILSSAKTFVASDAFEARFASLAEGETQVIGSALTRELFYFKHHYLDQEEGPDHLERNLIPYMSQVVSAHSPMLAAAQINVQVEFDRAFRTLAAEPAYQGKRLLYLAGLHIDLSPEEEQIFPVTQFVPWAAYFQDSDGSHEIYEQDTLYALLQEQSTENPDQIDLERAIQQMDEQSVGSG